MAFCREMRLFQQPPCPLLLFLLLLAYGELRVTS
jgi:hypothetical protein